MTWPLSRRGMNPLGETTSLLRLAALYRRHRFAAVQNFTIKPMSHGARLKNLATLSRQLHVLVSSGTPLVQALSAVERQCEDKRWKLVIEQEGIEGALARD